MKIKKLKIFFLILCVFQLFYLLYFRSIFQYEVLKDPFGTETGISFAVSPEIIETKEFLKKNKAKSFNLSDGFKNSNYLFQRTIEFNYPIRMEKNSIFFFFLNNEVIPSNCTVLETGKFIKLTQC